ncbi:MAG: hypothetical protein QXR06_02805 [Candidatus Bathyarchaeia archaeon]
MKIIALRNHRCYCCGSIVNKGEECFAFIVTPSNPQENEFDVIYTCLRCVNEETCKVKINARGGLIREK